MDEPVDVLAAQVREGLYPRTHMHINVTADDCTLCAPHSALDALVARVTEAEERENAWLRQRWGYQNRAEVAERGHKAALARDFAQRDEIKHLRAALADARSALEKARWFQRLFDSIVVADENDGTHRLYTDADLHAANVALREVLARLDGSSDE